MSQTTRLQLTDTIHSATIKMSDGNPGALRVCCQALAEGARIDPQDFLGGLGALVHMDSAQIYGPRIWMLYSDVCGRDLRIMLAILRAHQLGFITEAQLNTAIDNRGEGLDVPAIVASVELRLLQFQHATVTA